MNPFRVIAFSFAAYLAALVFTMAAGYWVADHAPQMWVYAHTRGW